VPKLFELLRPKNKAPPAGVRPPLKAIFPVNEEMVPEFVTGSEMAVVPVWADFFILLRFLK
jgi:hypothetical protein